MSAKTTGRIWDLILTPAERMVLLAMADHADHEGGGIEPELDLIAWKTGYSYRQVHRIVGELRRSGLLALVETKLGAPNTYRIDFTKATLKHPYKGVASPRKTQSSGKKQRQGYDKMSHGGYDKMSHPPDNMSYPPDKMSHGGYDMLANDHGSTLLENHDPPPPTPLPPTQNGGGDDSIDQEPTKTELYRWLRANGVKSPEAALRNQHHDVAATQAMHKRMVGDSVGDEREKRIGRFIKALDADGPPPIRAAPAPANYRAPPAPLSGTNSHAETRDKIRALAQQKANDHAD